MSAEAGDAVTGQTSKSDGVGGASMKRKHRPGLQRVQIACERCRSRKNKCDRGLPECSTCKAAGVKCIVVDRLTNRQYARGHVEGLESEVQRLTTRVKELEVEAEALRNELVHARGNLGADIGHSNSTPASNADASLQQTFSASPFGDIAEDMNVVPRDVTSSRRYVGDSSGLFFGNIVQAVLLQADYKGEHGPSDRSLRMRVGERAATSSTSPSHASPHPYHFEFPAPELAQRLQAAYFAHRWPSLPFMHRPSFLENHYAPSIALRSQASGVSLFLTLMVFAIGAIDIKRQNQSFGDKHLEYFTYATRNYLNDLLKEDSIETVQGLLLMAQFSINEQQSANAWLVAGQAVRTALDLGLHRNHKPPSSHIENMLGVEMRKRVFWAAYAIDRNISITLGRPCAVRDEDIDMPLPQNLKDDDLVGEYIQFAPARLTSPQPLDMSTFIHIIKLRRIQSNVQALFYSADTTRVNDQGIQFHQTYIRSQLDEWIARSPRYSHPTMATFQSNEWFQIAYSHALLLLYRPSPACPVIDPVALQICADSAISLISSYSSLYAKNKITYTWIALHSLFMASITMLYTLHVSPDIRASTTKAVVKSNVVSCLALFEVMSEYWPLATRCHDIIERLGSVTVALFDQPMNSVSNHGNADQSAQGSEPSMNQHFGQIGAEFMEWFGTRDSQNTSSFPSLGHAANAHTDMEYDDDEMAFSNDMDIFQDLNDFIPQEFDTTIPMMMTVFGNDPHGMHGPTQSDASDVPPTGPSGM